MELGFPPVTSESQVCEFRETSVTWRLNDWQANHEILAVGGASCTLTIDGPYGVTLRFFLQPTEKSIQCGDGFRIYLYYSLCFELMKPSEKGHGIVKVKATVPIPNISSSTVIERSGQVNLSLLPNGIRRVVIEDFLSINGWSLDANGYRTEMSAPGDKMHALRHEKDLLIKLDANMFQLTNTDYTMPCSISEENLLAAKWSAAARLHRMFL